MNFKLICDVCRSVDIKKGRSMDGRRVYKCRHCGKTWSMGLHRLKRFSKQRNGNQFADERDWRK